MVNLVFDLGVAHLAAVDPAPSPARRPSPPARRRGPLSDSTPLSWIRRQVTPYSLSDLLSAMAMDIIATAVSKKRLHHLFHSSAPTAPLRQPMHALIKQVTLRLPQMPGRSLWCACTSAELSPTPSSRLSAVSADRRLRPCPYCRAFRRRSAGSIRRCRCTVGAQWSPSCRR